MKANTGKTRYVLLGLMARGPQTGYSIKKAIEYEYSHFWQESFGQIYPTLKNLVEDGLAESIAPQGARTGRGQITYTITEAGKEELKRWLAEAPDVEKLRYEILLKVSFGSTSEPKIVIGHLDEFIKRNDKLINEMDGFLQIFKSSGSQGLHFADSELTALCGKYFYTAMKDWALDARKIILNRGAKK